MQKITLDELKYLYYEKGLLLKEIAINYKTSVGLLRKIMKRHQMPTLRGPSKNRKIIVNKTIIPLSLDETDIYNHIQSNIPSKVLEVLLGTLLGDGYIKIRQNKNNKIFNVLTGHSEKQLDYLKYKYNLITEQWANNIRKDVNAQKTEIKGNLYDRKDFYNFSTKPLNIQYIYDLLIKGRKIISKKYLSYLTPLSLAIWYMDDGSYNSHNRIIRFSTMCFTKEENEIIRDYFYNNLKMPCIVEKTNCGTGYSICLPQNSTKKFIQLTKPYACKTMLYKFADNSNPSETSNANQICK